MLVFTAQVDDGLVLFAERLGSVAYEDHQIRTFHRLLAALHTNGFYSIAGFTDAGGVNEPQFGFAQHDGFLYGVTCRTGDIGDDHTIIACDGIEQTALSDVGLAHDGGGNAAFQDTTLIVGFQQRMQSSPVGFQHGFVGIQTKILNILIGVIQHGVEMAAQIGQIVVNRCQLFLQNALHLTCSVGGGISGVRFNQIDDSFCFCQTQLAVQKCPFGEFTSLGRLCTGQIQRFQTGSQHGGAAVTVKLHGVFAGVAVRGAGNNGAAGIDGAAFLVQQPTQNQLPLRCAA